MPDLDSEFDSLTGEIAAYIRNCTERAPDALDDDDFDGLAIRLFRFQFKGVIPYRRFCENRGVDPSRVTRWEDIPALAVAAFKQQDVTSLTPGLRRRVFH